MASSLMKSLDVRHESDSGGNKIRMGRFERIFCIQRTWKPSISTDWASDLFRTIIKHVCPVAVSFAGSRPPASGRTRSADIDLLHL